MEEKLNRRKFISGGIRGSILAGLGIMSGVFFLRSKNESGEKCEIDFVCQNCSKLKHCGLQEAKDYKLSRIKR
jgi:hypothetical protein